jgi:hypothetical protein
MGGTIAAAANVATTLGIALALIVFILDRMRERRERELSTYIELSGKYFNYLQQLVEHPELSTTETEWGKSVDPSGSAKQSVVVQMAVNMIETAYYLYQGQRSSFRQTQWQGWRAYLEDWCAHPAFVAAWPEVVQQYDANFQAAVEKVFNEVHGVKAPA